MRFQCNHGVPASLLGAALLALVLLRFNATTAFLLPPSPKPFPGRRGAVSMPPRRSCFPGSRRAAGEAALAFQCHHGVPASLIMFLYRRARVYNAITTAFLLP